MVAYTVRHANTATSMACVTYFLTTCSNSLTCQHLGRALVSFSVTTCICIQLTLCRLLWPGRSSHGQCGSVWRNTCLQQSSLRSHNELLYSHYSLMWTEMLVCEQANMFQMPLFVPLNVLPLRASYHCTTSSSVMAIFLQSVTSIKKMPKLQVELF